MSYMWKSREQDSSSRIIFHPRDFLLLGGEAVSNFNPHPPPTLAQAVDCRGRDRMRDKRGTPWRVLSTLRWEGKGTNRGQVGRVEGAPLEANQRGDRAKRGLEASLGCLSYESYVLVL